MIDKTSNYLPIFWDDGSPVTSFDLTSIAKMRKLHSIYGHRLATLDEEQLTRLLKNNLFYPKSDTFLAFVRQSGDKEKMSRLISTWRSIAERTLNKFTKDDKISIILYHFTSLELEQLLPLYEKQNQKGTCECCEQEAMLVKHHWWEKGEPIKEDTMHTRMICLKCNSRLGTPNNKYNHVLPPWEVQRELVRKYNEREKNHIDDRYLH